MSQMITVLLPVGLFVLTLIIILALRAEDKKSRSLQTVKEKISSFRSESQQTIVRIQETCHDCADKVNAKKMEAESVIADIDRSLENLNNHKRNLSNLESICKSYEIALEKLKLQTEHAESRINVVQKEVEKAEVINKVVEAFKEEAFATEENLKAIQEEYKSLVERTNNELDSVVADHVEEEKAMLVHFSDELSKNREEFGTFIDEVRDDIESRKSDIKTFVDNSKSELETEKGILLSVFKEDEEALNSRKAEILSSCEEEKEKLEEKYQQFEEFFAAKDEAVNADKLALEELASSITESINTTKDTIIKRIEDKQNEHLTEFDRLDILLKESAAAVKTELENNRAENTAEFENLKNELEACSDELQSAADQKRIENEEAFASLSDALQVATTQLKKDIEDNRSGNEESFASLKAELEERETALHSDIDIVRNELASTLNSMIQSKDKLISEMEEESRKAEILLKDNKDSLDVIVKAAEDRVKEILDESISSIAASGKEAENNLISTADAVRMNIEKTRQDAQEIHQEQKDLIVKEEADYLTFCTEKVRSVMTQELEKIDGVFKAMSDSALKSIDNLMKRQSDIKESVSLLNQGANETIANTVERLNSLQNKLNTAEATLADTQIRVTNTKEELFNLQEEHRSLSKEISEARRNYENEQEKLVEAKNKRLEEEARSVKLQMESEERAKNKRSKSNRFESEDIVDTSTIEFTGEEEIIPLDDN